MRADLVYLDLGMSSMQVDNRERGFAYAYDAPLDMRMDPDQELTAYEIVNTWDRRRLARMIREYGEERFADRIAGEIVRRRGRAELTTTFELNEAITAADPGARALRRRPPGQAHLPGDPDRGQRRARPARRGAPARVGRPADRRPARGALVPLARGPARQALPRREGPRLHLPARAARLRLRQHAGGGARAPPLDRRHAGRGRGQPPFEVGSPAGRPQAQRGALTCPSTRPRHAPARPRSTRAGCPARPGGPSPPGRRCPGRTGAFERLSRLPDHRVVDRLLRSRGCIWVIGLMLGGIVAMQVSLLKLNAGISRAVQTQRTLELQNAGLQAAIAEATSASACARRPPSGR